MNTKKRLNCYIFSNLIVSCLSLNILTNGTTTELISKESSNTLNKIYEKEAIVETIETPDTIISTEQLPSVAQISNKNVQSENNYAYYKPTYNSVTGTNLVNYAKNFLGLRYVSAGNSLVTGTDCSGFTKLIYKEFGITLGRTVSSQIYNGTYVSKNDLEPGDLVFYSYGSVASHVAIYMGNGLIIHESNPRDGVKISSVNIMNYITARRLITSNVQSNSQQVEESKPALKEEVTPVKTEETKVISEEVKDSNIIQEETNKKEENIDTSLEPSTTNTSELQSENVKQTDDKTETKDDVETNITNDTTQKSDNLPENELVDDTTNNNK